MDLHRNSTQHATKVTPDSRVCDVYQDVIEFNRSFAAPLLQKKVDARFDTEQQGETPSLEKELYIAELSAEKKEAFENLLARNSPHLHSLGLSLSLLSNTTPTPDFSHEEASFYLDKGERFIAYLSSLQGRTINEEYRSVIFAIFEDCLSYLQFHSNLTDPEDTRSIEFAASIKGMVVVLQGVSELQNEPILSTLTRYQSFIDQKCLYEVILLERAGIFEIDSLRLNDSGREFIHIPFSNPSLRWHIICNNAENYRNVWAVPLSAIEKILSSPTMQQLAILAISTTLKNLHWIKQDLNSNGWSLRDEGESEDFRIVVDEVATKLTEMLEVIE